MEALLSEMLRESERGLEQQLKVLEDLDGKSEHLLTLGLATFGALVALSAFALERVPPPSCQALLAAALAADVGALLAFLHPYVGLFRRMDAFAGPSPAWLCEKVNLADWTLERHLVSLVSSYAAYHEHNAALVAHHRLSHRVGLLLLLLAAMAGAGAGVYVVAGML